MLLSGAERFRLTKTISPFHRRIEMIRTQNPVPDPTNRLASRLLAIVHYAVLPLFVGLTTVATLENEAFAQHQASASATGVEDTGPVEPINQQVEEYYRSLKQMWLLDTKIAALKERLALCKNQNVRRDPANEFVRAKDRIRRDYIDGSQGIWSINSYSIRNGIESKLLAAALISDPEQRRALYRRYERERIETNANRAQRTVVKNHDTLRKKVNAEVVVKLAEQTKKDFDRYVIDRVLSDLEKHDSRVSFGLRNLAIKMFVYKTPAPQNLDDVFDLEEATEKELEKLVTERARLTSGWKDHPLRSRANRGTHLAGQGAVPEAKMREYWSSIANQSKTQSDAAEANVNQNDPRLVVDNFGIQIYFPMRSKRVPVRIELRRGDGREGLQDGIPTQTRSHRALDTRMYPRFPDAIDLNGFVIMNLKNRSGAGWVHTTLDDIEQIIDVEKLASLAPDFNENANVTLTELLTFLNLDPSTVQRTNDTYHLQLN